MRIYDVETSKWRTIDDSIIVGKCSGSSLYTFPQQTKGQIFVGKTFDNGEIMMTESEVEIIPKTGYGVGLVSMPNMYPENPDFDGFFSEAFLFAKNDESLWVTLRFEITNISNKSYDVDVFDFKPSVKMIGNYDLVIFKK